MDNKEMEMENKETTAAKSTGKKASPKKEELLLEIEN